jgi:hypothetical protein
MSDAMVSVADQQLTRLTMGGVPVGDAASLVERATPERVELVREVHLPVSAAVVVDADGWVGDGRHALERATDSPHVQGFERRNESNW